MQQAECAIFIRLHAPPNAQQFAQQKRRFGLLVFQSNFQQFGGAFIVRKLRTAAQVQPCQQDIPGIVPVLQRRLQPLLGTRAVKRSSARRGHHEPKPILRSCVARLGQWQQSLSGRGKIACVIGFLNGFDAGGACALIGGLRAYWAGQSSGQNRCHAQTTEIIQIHCRKPNPEIVSPPHPKRGPSHQTTKNVTLGQVNNA